MGGYGSSRWRYQLTRRPVAEKSYMIPVKLVIEPLKAQDILCCDVNTGYRRSIGWLKRGLDAGSIGWVVTSLEDIDRPEIAFIYVRKGSDEAHRVKLIATVPNYGGRRWWFVCPGCTTRRGVLFISDRGPRCRVCLNITYLSSNQHQTQHPLRGMVNWLETSEKLTAVNR